MADYIDLSLALKGYYEQIGQLDKWSQIATYGFTPENIELLKEVPGMTFYYNDNGGILGWDYASSLPGTQNPLVPIDSNLQTGTYGSTSVTTKIPGNMSLDQTTGKYSFTSGLKDILNTPVSTIGGTAFLATAGVSLATKLGAWVDSKIYSLAPDWWDEHYPSINPETWADITTENDLGSQLFRSVFNISDNSNDATMYLDERALAYTYAMLLEAGVWSGEGGESTIDDTTGLNMAYITLPIVAFNGANITWKSNNTEYNMSIPSGIMCTCFVTYNSLSDRYTVHVITASESNIPHGTINGSSIYTVQATLNGHTFYYGAQNYWSRASQYQAPNVPYDTPNGDSSAITLSYILLYGTYTEHSGVEGIAPSNPEASTHIVPSNVINVNTGQPITAQDDIDDILEALKLAYPMLFANTLYEDVVQPDGTIQRINYNPVPYPDMEDPTQPTTDTTPGVDPQQNPGYDPETRPEGQTQGLTDSLTESPTTPDTGSGTTPPFVPPTGTANALYAIYNPSQGELNSFGAWLWSSNFVDQLLKLFNDPMQAIIGLHKVFVTPPVSGRQNIKVGYLDSGVASNVVGAQYVTVDCGSVSIPEYFGNVFDYDPFTQIHIYLPFVGIQQLDTGDVMRSTINVVYHCDVLTGACLVEVNVFRDGGGGVIYTYSGNCAVQYPISSGSYMGIIASLASVVGGVVGTVATGGALAPVAMGAVSGVLNAHTRVQHSGGFSGNAGAMGIKNPYVIITRPQTSLADNFPAFEGYPANHYTLIADCTGFIKCADCHVEQVPGTDAELSELENLLKSGIIL